MSLVPAETQVAPAQVINTKPLASALNSFFRTSQLSNIIDQTNILAELDNLRRITVAGPGGIEKERAASLSAISPHLSMVAFALLDLLRDQTLESSPTWRCMVV